MGDDKRRRRSLNESVGMAHGYEGLFLVPPIASDVPAARLAGASVEELVEQFEVELTAARRRASLRLVDRERPSSTARTAA